MRRLILAALATSALLTPVLANAQSDPRDEQGNYRSEWRHSNDQRDARRDHRDWRAYRNYDWNHREPGQNYYYADRYYRNDNSYQARRLSRNDRVYRGSDGRYYCRRSDGTTGLIIGGAVGGVLGNALSNGRSSTLGTLLGIAGGAALGSSIDRGQVQCR